MVPEACVAEAVAHLVVGGGRGGPRQRRPELAARLVPQVEGLVVWVGHRVIKPE